MNGSVAGGGGFSEEIINLTRRSSGLGFNIVGGTDQQYISNDSSIYVSRIKKDGAAYLDGRLQEGDKILSVNGRDLKDLRHKDAVELFRNAGCDVTLKIQRRGGWKQRGKREGRSLCSHIGITFLHLLPSNQCLRSTSTQCPATNPQPPLVPVADKILVENTPQPQTLL
uniref:Synaptojanin-2-binding protein n=1 Tax=Amazona collaria TaxID=241587 RepID=A0A8B9FR76_9PSIT